MAFDQQNLDTLNAFIPGDIRQPPKTDQEAIQRQQDMHAAARLSNPNIKGDILPTEPKEATYSTIGGTDAPIFGDTTFNVMRNGVRKPVPYVNTSTEYSMAKGLKSKSEMEQEAKEEQANKKKIEELAPRSGTGTIGDVSKPEFDESSVVGQPEANLSTFFTDYKDTFAQAAEVVNGLGEDQNLTDKEKQTVYRDYVSRMGKDDESGFFDNGGREALLSFGLSTLVSGDLRQGLASGFQSYGNVQQKQERMKQGQATIEEAKRAGLQVTPQQEQAMAAWVESGDDKLIPEFERESDQYKTTFTDANGNVTAIMQRPDGTTYTQAVGAAQQKPVERYGQIQLDPQTGEYGQYDQSGQFHRIISSKTGTSESESKSGSSASINADGSINYADSPDKYSAERQKEIARNSSFVAASQGIAGMIGYAEHAGDFIPSAERYLPKAMQSKETQMWNKHMSTYRNAAINALSGAAVSEPEAERLKQQLGDDKFGTDPEFTKSVIRDITRATALSDPRFINNSYGGKTGEVSRKTLNVLQHPDIDYAFADSNGNYHISYKEGSKKYKEANGKTMMFNPDSIFKSIMQPKKKMG